MYDEYEDIGDSDYAVCDRCGEAMYTDCMGNPRCDECDPPCPHCNDGVDYWGDHDDEVEYYDNSNWWDNQEWDVSIWEKDIPY